jgi:hypothetical protein
MSVASLKAALAKARAKKKPARKIAKKKPARKIARKANPLKKWIVFLIDEQFPDTEKGKADALAFAQRFADKHKVALGVYKA